MATPRSGALSVRLPDPPLRMPAVLVDDRLLVIARTDLQTFKDSLQQADWSEHRAALPPLRGGSLDDIHIMCDPNMLAAAELEVDGDVVVCTSLLGLSWRQLFRTSESGVTLRRSPAQPRGK